MIFPIWMLLGFALWTLAVLLFTVGIYRWSRILTGRAELQEFRADKVHGSEWYQRAMRAHANCVENLPVFTVLVFSLYVSGLSGGLVNTLCALVLGARVMQSLVHIFLPQTNLCVAVRFSFFFAQLVGFIWLAAIIIGNAS